MKAGQIIEFSIYGVNIVKGEYISTNIKNGGIKFKVISDTKNLYIKGEIAELHKSHFDTREQELIAKHQF